MGGSVGFIGWLWWIDFQRNESTPSLSFVLLEHYKRVRFDVVKAPTGIALPTSRVRNRLGGEERAYLEQCCASYSSISPKTIHPSSATGASS